ncbi:uncharacterized protein LOC133824040 [Humulus lupulus]|uniref:uncharacterized protein LOC133824040 n=1 Tax=Humulus lupulus TaxID=3486 RepID=UPI002B40B0EE|nr:uncharacterized protein LOC133824040 [Humulus lupulus]
MGVLGENLRDRGVFVKGIPCPISCVTLVVDVLGRMVDKAKSSSTFRGFTVGGDRVDVSHLQFADDTIFFVNDEESLVVGINVPEELVDRRASEIGCEVGQWPIHYLSLPLGASPRSRVFWEPIVLKCAKRLDGWKSGFLSRGGRLTLIQSVLSSIPVYYLSLFWIPKNVAGFIEKLMRDFLWEGADQSRADHLVSWQEVCKS